MLSINTNLSSYIAQRSLKQSTNALNIAIERMTTGYKINHAKDNAANYSIASDMNSKISSYMVAEENVAMGMDLLETATGSLELISDKLNRLRDLATQASNGTYGEDSLKAINKEANALVDEIERIYNTTEYNGIDLMKGRVTGSEESKFIKDIDRRDTSKMTSLASVDRTQKLEMGTYSITTADELAQLAEMTNNGLIGSNTEFVLGADIDLQAWCDAHSATGGWMPIGKEDSPFLAKFNGNGYVISDLIMNRTSGECQALFGAIRNASISNVALENVNITGYLYTAGLVGVSRASNINNCYTSGDLSTDYNFIGGLVAYALNGTNIENCSSSCNVDSNSSLWGYAGGLVGASEDRGRISNSFVKGGTVSSDGYSGGFIALCMDTEILNCYSENTLEVNRIGGGFVAAIRNSNITNCYTNTNVIKQGAALHAAAFLGCIGWGTVASSTINNCSVLNYSSDVSAVISGFHGVTDEELIVKDFKYNSNYDTNGIPVIPSGIDVSKYALQKVLAISDLIEPFTISNDSEIKTRDSSIALQVGTNSDTNSQISLDTGYNIDGISSLRGIGATEADYLTYIDRFISNLTNRTTEIGSVQNRLDSALESIGVNIENLTSSLSTIRDADIAEVSSEYIQQQILQQAAATLLATANQTPALALQLL